MYHKYFLYFSCIGLMSSMIGCAFDENQPIDYVNPYVGNISHLLVPTYPTVQLSNRLLRVTPGRIDYSGNYLKGLPIEVTSHISASDGQLYNDGGRPFHTDDWIWDTYRAHHLLRIMLNQKMEEDIINSYINVV